MKGIQTKLLHLLTDLGEIIPNHGGMGVQVGDAVASIFINNCILNHTTGGGEFEMATIAGFK